ncbi:MAG: hypothetical protein J1E63_07130 [Muribaculaceae bacterium]|nr:hypothetical protein [Muribaculaceae bacterium]
MKKILLTTALALAALAPQAKEFDYGYSNPKSVGDAGSYSQRPIALDASTSDCQTLYTYDELHDLYKVGSDGSITKASISEVSIILTGGMENYFSGASFDVTVYVENTTATSFPLNSDGKQVFFEYSKAISGKVTVDGDYSDEWHDFLEYGGYGTYETGLHVTIKLSEPIVYEGGSLLLTWKSESNGTEDLYYDGGSFGLDPKNGVKTLFVRDNKDLWVGTGGTSAETFLPAIQFTYDEVVQGPPAPEIVRGEPADFEVGDFNNPVIETGSTADFMPFDGAYAHSGTQALYTSVELNGLNKINGTEVTKAEIQDITFLVSAEDGMYFYNGEQFETTVYVQNTFATEFPKDSSGNITWMEYSEEFKGSVTVDFTEDEWEMFTWGEGGLYPVTIHLDDPITYEGNSLLMTFVTEADCGGETWVNATAAVSTNGVQGINMASDKETFASAYNGGNGYPKNTWSHVPVLKLHYVPVTEKGGAMVTPVSFENVTLSLVESTAKVGTTEKANAIAVSFELNDPSDCGSYEIKAGTTSLGTITSTTGTITYLGIPAGDAITLNVVPAGEGTIGVPYEIKKADLEVLFPAPVMEVSATATGDTQYELAKLPESVTMDGAAQFLFTNYKAAPVSQFNWLDIMSPADKNVYLLRNASGAMADIQAPYPSDYKNVQLNEGKIAFSKTDAVKATVDAKTGAVSSSVSGYLYFTLAIDYPLYYSATPTLDNAVAADLKATTIQRKYDNGQSYGSSQLRAEFKDGVTNPGKIQIIYPETLTWQNTESTITFVGPEGTTLHYRRIDPVAPTTIDADDDFTKHENELPYMVVNIADYEGASIHVQARKDDGTIHSENYLAVNDGKVTGVSNIEVDGVNAAAVEFYNLQGIRVNDTATPGIYIRRQGNSTTKVIVK